MGQTLGMRAWSSVVHNSFGPEPLSICAGLTLTHIAEPERLPLRIFGRLSG